MGDCTCPELSSELGTAVLVAKGDAGSLERDALLTEVFAGKTGNGIVLEFPLISS